MQNLMFYNNPELKDDGGLGSADNGDLVTKGKILKIRLSKRTLGPKEVVHILADWFSSFCRVREVCLFRVITLNIILEPFSP